MKHKKHEFDIPEHITYLNIAAQSPSFKTINDAGLEGLMQKRRPYLITGSDYFNPTIKLKKLFAKLIDADNYNRVAVIPSVSYGIATVANNIVLKASDEIVIIDEQFPSNYYSWQKLADKYGAAIKVVKSPEASNKGEQWNHDILEAINHNTALVAMGNIHWSNGTLFNLKAIRKKTKQHNALLIIDGSQSVGALPFSVKEIQPDALVCASYKWLFGPYGSAYAYYGSYFDNGNAIEENWTNRLNSEDFAGLTNFESQYKPLANRYTVGQSGNFIYIKMQIAALTQIIDWTPKAIQNFCEATTYKSVKALKTLGCEIEDSNFRTHHLFGVKVPDHINIDALKQALKEQNIFVSFRGKYIRLSCHLYNTEEDFSKFVSCLKSVL